MNKVLFLKELLKQRKNAKTETKQFRSLYSHIKIYLFLFIYFFY